MSRSEEEVNVKNKDVSSNSNSFESDPVRDKRVVEAASEKRSKKSRLVQATELRFKCVQNRATVARVAVLICNISDRPLFYKFKTDAMDALSALPSATGQMAAHGSSRVVLTWHRPKDVPWKDVNSPKLLLVTRFLDGQKQNNKDLSGTRLVAVLDPNSTCPTDSPPLEQLMLDAASRNVGDMEMTVTKTDEQAQNVVVQQESTLVTPPSQTAAETFVGSMSPLSLVVTVAALIIGLLLYRLLIPN
uniref:MSP domain-containing protein n=1 Tax=Panagrolaimus sp. JU765 TaxID=591449 RepID=A0AC34RFL8_9BILA